MKSNTKYQWFTTSVVKMLPKLFSLSNSRNTLVVVRRSVKGK